MCAGMVRGVRGASSLRTPTWSSMWSCWLSAQAFEPSIKRDRVVFGCASRSAGMLVVCSSTRTQPSFVSSFVIRILALVAACHPHLPHF